MTASFPFCEKIQGATTHRGIVAKRMELEMWIHKITTFPGDIQTPPGRGPVPPALGVPAQAGGLDKMISRGPFQPLPFCDSVIL